MKIVESALERFSLPPEAAGDCRAILSGGNYLSIENHRGLLEYSEEYILVALKKGRIGVRGKGLNLAAMEKEGLIIRGKILGIDVE